MAWDFVQDSFGGILTLDLPDGTDLSGGVTGVFAVRKPSGKLAFWTAALNDGADTASYTTIAGDLNESGDHLFQLELSDGRIARFETDEVTPLLFRVAPSVRYIAR